ncbi:MAG: dihydrofolate reductase [Bacteroidales bacterium]|jgi:dihydrofolate reductase|nr:dihydrofolate reductase [Bacteroidales bacterium]
MSFSIIVAIAQNMAIGKDNQLLWHLSEDLKYFKSITSGKTVIMGYNTWLSLPVRPLPNRKNIVLTLEPKKEDGLFIAAHSIEDVARLCENDGECFIIGGGSIYKQFLPIADKLYITWVYRDFDADIYFSKIDFSQWKEISRTPRKTDEKSGLEFDFTVYERNA